MLTRWLLRGARRMLGELPPEPLSLFNTAVAGRNASATHVRRRHLERHEALAARRRTTDSNAPERVEPRVGRRGVRRADGTATPLSSLTPLDAHGLRAGGRSGDGRDDGRACACRTPSALVYDIAGRGFTRFRGSIALENPRSEIGSTLNPALRFFVFDAEPEHGSPAAAGAAAAAAGRRRR